jgi:UTP--glucose-1-phosphate uridylyltransferase
MALDFDGRRYDSGNLKGYIETIIDFALEHPETGPWLKQFLQNKTL